jgi:hypothetical protein
MNAWGANLVLNNARHHTKALVELPFLHNGYMYQRADLR